MCVIIYKPRGVSIPDMETLEDCFYSNPHGFGYAIKRANKPLIVRGLMDWWELEKLRVIQPSDEAVIHFRLASVGDISPVLTHPIPIADRPTKLKKSSERLIVHNGHIEGIGGKCGKSDTLILAETLSSFSNDEIRTILRFLAKTTGSKFVFMHESGTELYGSFKEMKGCLYSNFQFKEFNRFTYYNKPSNGLERYYKGFELIWR